MPTKKRTLFIASQLPILSKNFTVVSILLAAQELFAQEEYETVIDLCDAMLKHL